MGPEQAGLSTELFLGVIRRRAVWIMLCVVVGTGAAYAYSKQKTKMYTATAAVTFNTDPLAEQIAGLSGGGASSSLLAQQTSDRELVRLGDVAAKTADQLGHGLTGETVASSLSVGGQAESNIVSVAATAASPVLAADIANTYVRRFVREQQRTNRAFFRSALSLVNRQLAALSPAQRIGPDGLALQDRAQTLGFLANLDTNSVVVAGEALVPSSPSSPRTKRNTILGAIFGLLVGLGIALLLERFDRRIRRPEDLEAIYGLPMLGSVPTSAVLSRSGRRDGDKRRVLAGVDADAFSLIRAHLHFFNVDREMRTVLIASPTPGDGKTTVAHHLAEAAARSGARVLILELDLRRPALARRLDIEPGPGLAGALIGAVSLDDAVQSVALGLPNSEGTQASTIDVLVAGNVLPPNPGELLESHAMDAVLSRVRAAYDLVVIDTPSLMVVSDAFPLLTKVDGVVIVGRVGHSRIDTAAQLRQTLDGSNVALVGVIANCARPVGAASYAASDSGMSVPAAASVNGALSSEELFQTTKS
jgi:polysaccharide biosynthesis transport protein